MLRIRLEEAEVDLDGGEDIDGRSVPGAGLEAPLGDGRNGFSVEAETGGAEDIDVLRESARVNFDREDGGSGELGRPGFLAICRLDLGEELGR